MLTTSIEKDYVKILRLAYLFTFGEPKAMSKVEFIRREEDFVFWRVFGPRPNAKGNGTRKEGKSTVVRMDLAAFIKVRECLVNVNDED